MPFSANRRYFTDKSSFHNLFSRPHSQDAGTFKSKRGVGFKHASSYYCDHCKVNGHSIERCFKINGFPPGFKPKKFAGSVQEHDNKSDFENIGLSATQIDNLMSFLTKHKETADSENMDLDALPSSAHLAGKFCFLSKSHTSRWIVDSGATDHMCNSLDSFIYVQKIHGATHSVTIPDGRNVLVEYFGDVMLMNDILLKKALYVPEFQFNLISVPKLCVDDCSTVLFTNGACMIQDHLKTRVLGRLSHGLYYANIPCSITSSSTCVAAENSTSNKATFDLVKL